MKRREFLKWLMGAFGSATVSIFFAGCGGGESSFSSSDTLQVQVDHDKTVKTISVDSGETALDAIKKAFSYQKLQDATVIDGISGNWRYSVNGIEPTIYAGNYLLNTDSQIHLRLI